MTAEQKIDALLVEMLIKYSPHRYFGPPKIQGPLPPPRPGDHGFRPEHKWLQQYESLTCMGKSWRSAV